MARQEETRKLCVAGVQWCACFSAAVATCGSCTARGGCFARLLCGIGMGL